jgi:hypothetical protein
VPELTIGTVAPVSRNHARLKRSGIIEMRVHHKNPPVYPIGVAAGSATAAKRIVPPRTHNKDAAKTREQEFFTQ